MPIYEVRLIETWKDKETGKEQEPTLASPVNVLAGSGEDAIETAKASAMLKDAKDEVSSLAGERLTEDFHEVMSKVSVEAIHRICDIDLRA